MDDDLDCISGIVFDWGNSTDDATGENVLSPNESVMGTATYEITQDDIDTGKVVNTAMAHMMADVADKVDSNEDTVETTLAVHEVENSEPTISDIATDVIETAKEALTQTGAKSYVGIGVLTLVGFAAYKVVKRYLKK